MGWVSQHFLQSEDLFVFQKIYLFFYFFFKNQ